MPPRHEGTLPGILMIAVDVMHPMAVNCIDVFIDDELIEPGGDILVELNMKCFDTKTNQFRTDQSGGICSLAQSYFRPSYQLTISIFVCRIGNNNHGDIITTVNMVDKCSRAAKL